MPKKWRRSLQKEKKTPSRDQYEAQTSGVKLKSERKYRENNIKTAPAVSAASEN
jgi:hypothetical protein